MKKFKLVLICLLSMFLLSSETFPQVSGLTLKKAVKPHEEIDNIYRTFVKGYVDLDAKRISELYSADAAYLVPDSEILIGRESVFGSFTEFFSEVEKNGEKIAISFEIAQRLVSNTVGYDVGEYTLSIIKDQKSVFTMRGKFVTVSVKGADNKWRFQVDGYSLIRPPVQ